MFVHIVRLPGRKVLFLLFGMALFVVCSWIVDCSLLNLNSDISRIYFTNYIFDLGQQIPYELMYITVTVFILT